jgi:hypothetical protein
MTIKLSVRIDRAAQDDTVKRCDGWSQCFLRVCQPVYSVQLAALEPWTGFSSLPNLYRQTFSFSFTVCVSSMKLSYRLCYLPSINGTPLLYALRRLELIVLG